MAVQPWELGSEQVKTPPRLELVPAPPRGGRAIPALVFVTLLVGLLGLPVLRAATKAPPIALSWTPRPVPASQIATLDPIGGLPKAGPPRSSEPLGGILFVRCTNLWTALPDGSHPRKLLQFPGISSPTFSPDARTIAFIGPTDAGQGLYMVGADGSRLTELGSFAHEGAPIGARVANLTWSPDGKSLAFALVDHAEGIWTGGSTVWTYRLDGSAFDHDAFERIASGTSPGFVGRRLVYATWADTYRDTGPSFTSGSDTGMSLAWRLSSKDADYAFALAPDAFSDSMASKRGVVILRTKGGQLELATRASAWDRNARSSYRVPSPYSFFTAGRVSVSQDTQQVLADLIDPRGDRSIGILDLDSGKWTVLDYAWSPAATTAPTASGPVGARRAMRLAEDIFSSSRQRSDTSAAALMIGKRDRDAMSKWLGGYTLGEPTKTGDGWGVYATIYGSRHRRYYYRNADLLLARTKDHRIEAQLDWASPRIRIETIADARTFITSVMGNEGGAAWPSYLPAGVTLNKRWPVDAYSYDGLMTVTIQMVLSKVDGEKFRRSLSLSYGDLNLGLGCGDASEPEEAQVGSLPGLYDHMGSGPQATRAVMWPATLLDRDTSSYSVRGQIPRATLERIAESMTD